MTFVMPYAYGSTLLTEEQLKQKATFYRLHPEVQRRFLALSKFLHSIDVPLGVGTGWRIQPENKPGFARPGNSWHEGVPVSAQANALAIDTVPASSWAKMEPHLAAFGFRSFKNVNNEPWHIQPIEIPTSRRYATTLPAILVYQLPYEETEIMHGFVARPDDVDGRILDTRGTGSSRDAYKLNANRPASVAVPNGAGKSHAIVNLTVTEPEAAGFLTAWAKGALPNSSKLNFTAGQTIANEVTVPLSNGGFLISSIARTHVVIDLVGYYQKI